MDPVSALGLVSAILTFIDFAHKVVTGADELYQKATTDENAHIENIVNDLDDAATDLTSLPAITKHEKALNRLAEKCREVSCELQQLLWGLTVSGNRTSWKALKIAVRNIRKESMIAKLLARLDKYRGELLLRLSLMLNDQQCSIKQRLDRLETEGLKFSNESATQLKNLREDIIRSVKELTEKDGGIGTGTDPGTTPGGSMPDIHQSLDILSSMMATVPKENNILRSLYFPSMNTRETTIDNAEDGTFEWIFDEETESTDSGDERIQYDEEDQDNQNSDAGSNVHSLRSEPTEGDTEPRAVNNGSNHVSIRSLSPDLSSTSEASYETSSELEDYYERKRETREDELQKRYTARCNFMTWLSSGKGIFHIIGKPGSGKSTIMKFLCSHGRVQEELHDWAGEEKKLVFARFYFWKSSNDNLQMSLPGLYRSILYETLKHYPNLIPELFPRQWNILSTGIPYVVEDLITDEDAHDAFQALTTKGTFPKHRFCFFLDGLDEYNGQVPQQLKLARDIQRWASGEDVKICASSRPYIQFDMLVSSDDQRIHLHELTRHDIYLFSRKMINDNLEEVQDHHLRLIEAVVDKSEGVFLWARLVLCSLLEGMIRHDDEEALQKKLDVTPPDIGGLYQELLSSLSSDDRLRAEKVLLLAAHDTHCPCLGSVAYAFVDELSDLAFPPLDGKRPSSWRTFDQTANVVRLQLKSLTKGLLELGPLPQSSDTKSKYIKEMKGVRFLHRTVQDFVLEHYSTNTMLAHFPWIAKRETYYRLWLAELLLMDASSRGYAWRNNQRYNHKIFTVELSVDLLEGFKSTLECEDSVSNMFAEAYAPEGRQHECWQYWFEGPLSFVHHAAFCGQSEYVKLQIKKSPELSRSCNGYHILLSAAIGKAVDLVSWLLKNGSNPTDYIECYTQTQEVDFRRYRSEPLWCFLLMYLINGLVLHRNIDVKPWLWDILELLLRHLRVSVGDPLFFISDIEEMSPSFYCTLSQAIEDIQPANTDQLKILLGQSGKKWLLNGGRRLLLRFTSVFEQSDGLLKKHASGLTRFRHVRDHPGTFICKEAVFGDLVLKSPITKLY